MTENATDKRAWEAKSGKASESARLQAAGTLVAHAWHAGWTSRPVFLVVSSSSSLRTDTTMLCQKVCTGVAFLVALLLKKNAFDDTLYQKRRSHTV